VRNASLVCLVIFQGCETLGDRLFFAEGLKLCKDSGKK
jgi:hypothetical protein